MNNTKQIVKQIVKLIILSIVAYAILKSFPATVTATERWKYKILAITESEICNAEGKNDTSIITKYFKQ